MMHFFQSQPFSITALTKINCNLLNETLLISGLSELRIHIASLSDGGLYQCSTSQNYDYIKYETSTWVFSTDIIWPQIQLHHPAQCRGHGGGDRGGLQTQIHSWRSDIRHDGSPVSIALLASVFGVQIMGDASNLKLRQKTKSGRIEY